MITAYFDRDHFEKILFNLLSNAFKHTPVSGQVCVELIERPDNIVIMVTNSGKGIKPEHFDQIFESFFSYDEDRNATGTGIGLALVKSLVDAHHGMIEVASPGNGNTRFTVTLLRGHAHFEPSEITANSDDPDQLEMYPVYSPDLISAEATPTELLTIQYPQLQKQARKNAASALMSQRIKRSELSKG